MKNIHLILFGLVIGLLVAWVGWGHASHAVATSPAPAPIVASAPLPSTPPPARPAVNPNLPVAADWQRFRTTRDQAFQANPALATEYKTIIADMDTQQKQLDAAMIKADPAVTQIVTKLQTLRQRNSVPSPGSLAKPAVTGPAPTVSTEEWGQLRNARQIAMQTNPSLVKRAGDLKTQMMAFQDKLTTAMLKANPQIADTLDKLEPARPKSASVPTASK